MQTPTSFDFFDGFEWPVLTAFASELAKCRFERGDIFYDTPKGYWDWQQAQKHLSFSIQVRFPAHEGGTKGSTDASVFATNWKSPVRFRLTNYKTNETKEVTTTQGRLYSLLWRGDWSVLDDSKKQAIPLTCLDSELTNLAKKATPDIRTKFCADFKTPNLFLVARDITNPISVAKTNSVRKGLSKSFKFSEKLFSPVELGVEGVAPTVKFVCFMVETKDSETLFHVLREILYVPSEDTKSNKRKFNLRVHGSFLPFTPLPFGDYYSWEELGRDGLAG